MQKSVNHGSLHSCTEIMDDGSTTQLNYRVDQGEEDTKSIMKIKKSKISQLNRQQTEITV